MPYDDTGFERPEVQRLDAAIALIDTPEKWCKRQLRTRDGRRCMLGALVDVDAIIDMHEVTDAILLAVKQVTGLNFLRIEAFNDHPATKHVTVMQVLARARENLVAGIGRGTFEPEREPCDSLLSRIRKVLAFS